MRDDTSVRQEPSNSDAAAYQGPAPDAGMHHAFISYARRDRWIAKALKRALVQRRGPRKAYARNADLSVFLDSETLTAAASLRAALRDHVRQSRHLVLLCSPEAAQSQHVNDELETFLEIRTRDDVTLLLCRGHLEESLPGVLRNPADPPLYIDLRPSGLLGRASQLVAIATAGRKLRLRVGGERRRDVLGPSAWGFRARLALTFVIAVTVSAGGIWLGQQDIDSRLSLWQMASMERADSLEVMRTRDSLALAHIELLAVGRDARRAEEARALIDEMLLADLLVERVWLRLEAFARAPTRVGAAELLAMSDSLPHFAPQHRILASDGLLWDSDRLLLWRGEEIVEFTLSSLQRTGRVWPTPFAESALWRDMWRSDSELVGAIELSDGGGRSYVLYPDSSTPRVEVGDVSDAGVVESAADAQRDIETLKRLMLRGSMRGDLEEVTPDRVLSIAPNGNAAVYWCGPEHGSGPCLVNDAGMQMALGFTGWHFFSESGRFLYGYGGPGAPPFEVVDVGRMQRVWADYGNVYNAVVSRDDRWLAAAIEDFGILLVRIDSLAAAVRAGQDVADSREWVRAVFYPPEWEGETGLPYSFRRLELTFDPQSERLVARVGGEAVYVWELQALGRTLVATSWAPRLPRAEALASDGYWLIAVAPDGEVRGVAHEHSEVQTAWTRVGTPMALGWFDSDLWLFGARRFQRIAMETFMTEAVGPWEGRFLAGDGGLSLVELPAGEVEFRRSPIAPGKIVAVGPVESASVLSERAAIAARGKVSVLNIHGTVLHTRPAAPGSRVQLASGGTVVVVASYDTVVVVEVDTGRTLLDRQFPTIIEAVAVTGDMVAVAEVGGRVTIFKAANGAPVGVQANATGPLKALEFIGPRIAYLLESGRVELHVWDPEEVVNVVCRRLKDQPGGWGRQRWVLVEPMYTSVTCG